MAHKLLTLLLAATALSACTMAPRYERPEAPVAAAWPAASMPDTVSGTQPQPTASDWRSMFKSPELQKLIETALANNRDLRIATLNVEAARAAYRIQRADLLPSVNASGTGTRQRIPENASATGQSNIASSYSANVGATAFELDLFGRIRSLSRRAANQYLATDEGRKAAQTTLIAEVANAYLTYLADHELLTLTENTLNAQQESYTIIQRSFEMGVGSQLDVSQAATQVESARANLARYTRLVEQDKNALTLLVGQPIPPEDLPAAGLGSVAVPDELPAGMPSDVLLQRPDIRQAEYVLKGENANIGAARAAFFPSISLTGSAGFASDSLSNLFSTGSGGAWAFTPQVSLPIFQGGRRWANLSLANTNRDIAIAQYEKAIQSAFREVSDALAARSTYTEQLQAQQSLVQESETAHTISQARYKEGLDSHLTLLVSQRALYSAQQDEINVRLERLSNLVNLYKSLGGGQN